MPACRCCYTSAAACAWLVHSPGERWKPLPRPPAHPPTCFLRARYGQRCSPYLRQMRLKMVSPTPSTSQAWLLGCSSGEGERQERGGQGAVTSGRSSGVPASCWRCCSGAGRMARGPGAWSRAARGPKGRPAGFRPLGGATRQNAAGRRVRPRFCSPNRSAALTRWNTEARLSQVTLLVYTPAAGRHGPPKLGNHAAIRVARRLPATPAPAPPLGMSPARGPAAPSCAAR